VSIARVHYVKHARQRYERTAKHDEDGATVRSVVTRRDGTPKTTPKGRVITRRQTETVKDRPLPNYKCGKCGTEIKVGDPYRWFQVGFRSHYKQVRCVEISCSPKTSELESSKLSSVYAAIEDAEATIAEADEPDEIESAVQDVANTVREVADEYREASVNPNTGAVFNTEAEERADTLDSSADELESWSHTQDQEPETCEEHSGDDEDDCEECQELRDSWIEAIRGEAIDAVNIDM
jgi:hypothetical protein